MFSKYSPFAFNFTLWNFFSLFVVPFPSCPLSLYPDVHTVPSLLSITEKFPPAAMSIASSIFSSFLLPSLNSISAIACVGFILFVSSPTPNSPFVFIPYPHTVPSPFSVIKWLYPPSIFANVSFPSPFTFTFTLAVMSFSSSFISIYVVPSSCAVIIPVLLTVAILLSKVLNVTFGIN